MEDTLRVLLNFSYYREKPLVLILVLMEDTLRVREHLSKDAYKNGLNPCFNGRYSQRQRSESTFQKVLISLNPCFNGRYSQRPFKRCL